MHDVIIYILMVKVYYVHAHEKDMHLFLCKFFKKNLYVCLYEGYFRRKCKKSTGMQHASSNPGGE